MMVCSTGIVLIGSSAAHRAVGGTIAGAILVGAHGVGTWAAISPKSRKQVWEWAIVTLGFPVLAAFIALSPYPEAALCVAPLVVCWAAGRILARHALADRPNWEDAVPGVIFCALLLGLLDLVLSPWFGAWMMAATVIVFLATLVTVGLYLLVRQASETEGEWIHVVVPGVVLVVVLLGVLYAAGDLFLAVMRQPGM
jgi:hypothetical protein